LSIRPGLELCSYRRFAGGGASGFCVKSKQSVIPSDAASRAFNAVNPNVSSRNLTKLTKHESLD
jgi:hypothetical protein